jgi:hypothetical protein
MKKCLILVFCFFTAAFGAERPNSNVCQLLVTQWLSNQKSLDDYLKLGCSKNFMVKTLNEMLPEEKEEKEEKKRSKSLYQDLKAAGYSEEEIREGLGQFLQEAGFSDEEINAYFELESGKSN